MASGGMYTYLLKIIGTKCSGLCYLTRSDSKGIDLKQETRMLLGWFRREIFFKRLDFIELPTSHNVVLRLGFQVQVYCLLRTD